MFRRFLSRSLAVVLTLALFVSMAASVSAATLLPTVPSTKAIPNLTQIKEPLGSTVGIGQALAPSQYYGRQLLVKSGNQRLVNIYDALAEGLANYQSVILLDTQYGGPYWSSEYLPREEFIKVVNYYNYDHPETFWLKSYTLTRAFYKDALGATYRQVTVNFEFSMTKDEILAQQTQLKNYTQKTLLPIKLNSKMSDYEREQYIFKFLHNSANVDKTKKTSYARAFQYSMQKCGIQCLTVIGTYNNQDHAWNLVQFGNVWYAVDVARNAFFKVSDAEDSAYFNFSPSQMSAMGYTITIPDAEYDYLPTF